VKRKQLRLPFTKKALRDEALIRVLLDLGLRGAEVSKLNASDFDNTANTLSVPRKGWAKRYPLQTPRKTGDALRAWLKVRGDAVGPLFIALDNRTRGRRISDHGIAHILKLARASMFAGETE